MSNCINNTLVTEFFKDVDVKECNKYFDTLAIIKMHLNNGNINDALKFIINASNFLVENLPNTSSHRKLMNYTASELVSSYEQLMLLIKYRNNRVNDK